MDKKRIEELVAEALELSELLPSDRGKEHFTNALTTAVRETLEEAAKVARVRSDDWTAKETSDGIDRLAFKAFALEGADIAAAIRKLKEGM